jgi:hypothetical protein
MSQQGYLLSSLGDDAKWSLSQAIVGLHRKYPGRSSSL